MLARKISRAKWLPKAYLAETEISADAIGGCLRTAGGKLSWWRCTEDEKGVAEVALALATGPLIEKFETIFVVVLSEAVLVEAGLASKQTKGLTAVGDLRPRHVDLVNLDVVRLARVADILGPLIRSGDRVTTFTRAELKLLVIEAIRGHRLDVGCLSEKLRAELAKAQDARAS